MATTDEPKGVDEQHMIESTKAKSFGLFLKRTLTHDEKLAQADAFRLRREQLNNTLQSIEITFFSPSHEPHSGQPNCQRCADKNQKIIQAFYDYFLSSDSANWYAEFPNYKNEMQERFQRIKNPSVKELKDLYQIFCSMLREYILNFLEDDDGDDNAELSNLDPDLSNNISMKDLVERVYNSVLPHYPNPDAKNLVLALQEAKNPAERAPLYSRYYCAPLEDDTNQQKNFKAKFARMFESRSTHDEVLSAMRKEAQELHINKLSALHKELSELQLAQSAHLKNKARKAEKDQRMRDRESDPKSAFCSLKTCKTELDLNDENIECAICDWLHNKGDSRGRFYYCSVQHAEEDFDEHEHHEHQCVAKNRCFYYPQTGPPGETAAAGICLSCLQNRRGLFYFCSNDCYRHNLDWHTSRHHTVESEREDSNILEPFQFTPDMKAY